jgi:hypothetical protein
MAWQRQRDTCTKKPISHLHLLKSEAPRILQFSWHPVKAEFAVLSTCNGIEASRYGYSRLPGGVLLASMNWKAEIDIFNTPISAVGIFQRT